MYFVKIPGEKMAKYDLKYAWNCLIIFTSLKETFYWLKNYFN
jgi:hypothetical protein